MTANPWPDHLLTLQEWDELPEDAAHRCELVEGVLIVVPRPMPPHQRAAFGLSVTLEQQLPKDLAILQDVDVVIDAQPPITVRAPDVVVTRYERSLEPRRLDAADVLLAVEIISPGTQRTDRITKLVEYADAGIPNYWIIDLDEPATLTAYLLVDGDYEIVAETTEGGTLSQPAPVTVDVRTLTARL